MFALADRVMQTHDAYAAACEACYGAPDEAMTEWRKHNPSPDKSAGADEYKAAMARWRRRKRAAAVSYTHLDVYKRQVLAVSTGAIIDAIVQFTGNS